MPASVGEFCFAFGLHHVQSSKIHTYKASPVFCPSPSRNFGCLQAELLAKPMPPPAPMSVLLGRGMRSKLKNLWSHAAQELGQVYEQVLTWELAHVGAEEENELTVTHCAYLIGLSHTQASVWRRRVVAIMAADLTLAWRGALQLIQSQPARSGSRAPPLKGPVTQQLARTHHFHAEARAARRQEHFRATRIGA